MRLRVQPVDTARHWVVEAIIERSGPGSRERLDKTVVVGRCLHLHLVKDRAEACLSNLNHLPDAIRPSFMQEPAGKQTPQRIAKRKAKQESV